MGSTDGRESAAKEIIDTLRGFGLTLYIEEGIVRGRMGEGRIPYEARAWIDRLQVYNDMVARLLGAETTKVLVGLTVEQALPICERVRQGDIVLVGKVVYHVATMLVDISYRERNEPEQRVTQLS